MASDRDSEGDEEFYETDDLSEVHQGIINDDLDLLRQALEAGVDANKKFSADINPQHEGMTPLALASALNKIEAVKILLTYRANVNDTFASLKTTALMTSSFHGHSEVVRILLKKGADVRAVDLQGSTALGYAFGGARTIDVICQLLKAGVDVNQKNMLGMSALLLVAGYGNDVLAKMILDAGADANAVNDFGHSALHLTVVGKRSQIKKLTSGQTGPYGLNRRNIDVALKEWARLHSDTLRGRDNERELEKVGQFMMNIGSKLDERENINDDDNEAMKRRVEAVWRHRQDNIQGEKEKKKPGFVDNFLSCGGKRSKQAKQQRDGKSPTSRPLVPLDNDGGRYNVPPEVDREINLISDSCSKILRMITDSGCEIDKMEKTFGMTALDMAILLGDVESTAVLVAAGGDASHLVKMFALTDLYEAMAQSDKKQVKELLTYDTDLDVNQPFSQFNITRRRGTAAGEPDNLKSDGLTPLTVAAQMSEVEVLDIMKMLQKQGADVNRVGPGGSCPIAEACRMGNLKMVQFLVAQGASVETKSPAYQDATPVVIAAMFRHRPVVEFLLSKEAKIDKLMTDGRSALIKAVENDDRAMVETLLNANLLDNFSDRNSFSYAMADTYQRPDRDFDSLMRTMIDEARHLADREREESIRQQGKMPRVQQPNISMATNPMATTKQSNHRRQTALDEPNHHQAAPPAPGSRGFRGAPEVMVVQDNDVNRQRQKQPRPPSPAESSEEEDEDEDDEDDDEEDIGLNQQVPVMQQKLQQQKQPQPKQPKNQPRQPPPPVPPPAHSSSEEEDDDEEEEEVKVAPPPVKQKKQAKLVELQLKQQQQPLPKQQVQQPKLPPPPAESSSEEEEVVKQPLKQPFKQQIQPQKQPQQQQQHKKEEPQVRKPIPPERSSSEEDESEEEEDEEEETAVANKPQQQQQQPQIKPQQLQKQPLPTVAKQQQQQPPKQLPPPTKKPESSEEEDSEEEEESEEEESEDEPPRVVSTQLPKQPPQPQAPPPVSAGSKAPSRPPVVHPPPPAAKPNAPQSSEEESEEEESEEEESEEEEEVKPLPQQQPPPPKSSFPVILPSARLENRSFPVLTTKDPGPKPSSTPARPPNNVKPDRGGGTTTPNSNSKSIPSRAVPAPVQSPMSPNGPPPPLPSTGPPSDTPSDSDDEEEWDEDGDFDEHHVPVGAKDDISGRKAGTNQSTKTSVSKVPGGGVVTRTVVTKTVVKSGVVKSVGEPLVKGRVNIAKVEDSDDEDEDDDDEDDDDEEEERGRLHHSTETDI